MLLSVHPLDDSHYYFLQEKNEVNAKKKSVH